MAINERRQDGHWSRADEHGLLARLKLRDLRAFEALYRLHHPRLAHFVLNIVRRPPLVEEVVNDTMMVLWENPESFRGQAKLSTWLFSIAYRKALRARHRQDEPVEDHALAQRADESAPPDHQLRHRQTAARLQSAIAELSPDHRAVVHLTYFQECGYREIAEILECPVDTVKTRMFHARRHLKRKLAGELGDWL